MRIMTLIMGLLFIVVAIPGYVMTPGLISKMVSMFTGGAGESQSTASLMTQMGFPSMEVMATMIQYSFVGLEFVGVGIAAFGALAKKPVPRFALMEKELSQYQINKVVADNEEKSPNPLNILQERLAKGEITSAQFIDLKGLLDLDKPQPTEINTKI